DLPLLLCPHPPTSTLLPYTTLFRSLQLGGGKFNGEQLIRAKALAETHRPQIVSRAPRNPATDRATFYGLGWNVNYDDGGRVQLRSEEHTSELQSLTNLVCPLLLSKN